MSHSFEDLLMLIHEYHGQIEEKDREIATQNEYIYELEAAVQTLAEQLNTQLTLLREEQLQREKLIEEQRTLDQKAAEAQELNARELQKLSIELANTYEENISYQHRLKEYEELINNHQSQILDLTALVGGLTGPAVFQTPDKSLVKLKWTEIEHKDEATCSATKDSDSGDGEEEEDEDELSPSKLTINRDLSNKGQHSIHRRQVINNSVSAPSSGESIVSRFRSSPQLPSSFPLPPAPPPADLRNYRDRTTNNNTNCNLDQSMKTAASSSKTPSTSTWKDGRKHEALYQPIHGDRDYYQWYIENNNTEQRNDQGTRESRIKDEEEKSNGHMIDR